MTRDNAPRPLISVRSLTVDYAPGTVARLFGAPTIHAVHNVSFGVAKGQTFGIVGESGSGKSTTARAIIGLEQAQSGSVLYDGQDMKALRASRRRDTARDIQMVFQDPSAALNPKLRIGRLIAERVKIHRPREFGNRVQIVRRALDEVGLPHAHVDRFPHQLSGGQQQRVVIALGLVSQPRMLICDEAVSGLDVSSQAQVLNLLNELKESRGLSIIFITHDMGVARYISDEIAVMRRGVIVERGPAESIFHDPQSEYTKALVGAVPALPGAHLFTGA
jgi:ABC-type glutathione transport system ATPase component